MKRLFFASLLLISLWGSVFGQVKSQSVFPGYEPEEVFDFTLQEFRSRKFLYLDSLPSQRAYVFANDARIICLGIIEDGRLHYWRIFSLAEEARAMEFIKCKFEPRLEEVVLAGKSYLAIHLEGTRQRIFRDFSANDDDRGKNEQELNVKLNGIQFWDLSSRRRFLAHWLLEIADFHNPLNSDKSYSYVCLRSLDWNSSGRFVLGKGQCEGKARFPGGFVDSEGPRGLIFREGTCYFEE